jgi:hypothetical protein
MSFFSTTLFFLAKGVYIAEQHVKTRKFKDSGKEGHVLPTCMQVFLYQTLSKFGFCFCARELVLHA